MNNSNNRTAYLLSRAALGLSAVVAIILLVWGLNYLTQYFYPQPVQAIFSNAMGAYQDGDYNTAKKLFKITLIKGGSGPNYVYHANRGLMLIAVKDGQYALAERYFTRAATSSLMTYSLFNDIAYLYFDPNGALTSHQDIFFRTLVKANEILETDVNMALTAARYYRDSGMREEAIHWFEVALERGATNRVAIEEDVAKLKAGQ
ncbi:hypothetical protein A2V68_00170 [candidate division Kazan bacterium RBG_13_50_9]|uniref:Tetratricopeptide repeat-like domain-containing protein n=1 Tax=candidate division Kazan bacterium RBG_13_50_9 TaxID=1798535 RepID=A0A1F4NRQ6_UNCK3|nr:MAG: hypothetical protein A2V68_00170 [candidate division Kazan bacterium RBG_13_50_9]